MLTAATVRHGDSWSVATGRTGYVTPTYPLQVVQCLTDLGLSFMKARITSDGGWFVDGAHLSAHLRAIVFVLDCERRRSWNQMDTAIEYAGRTYKHAFTNSLQPRWCSGGFQRSSQLVGVLAAAKSAA